MCMEITASGGGVDSDSDLTIETSGDPTPDGLTAWAYSTDTGTFLANTMAGVADENGIDYNTY